MFTNATNKFWSLVLMGLTDVDGFKICIQVCLWLGFPPLCYKSLWLKLTMLTLRIVNRTFQHQLSLKLWVRCRISIVLLQNGTGRYRTTIGSQPLLLKWVGLHISESKISTAELELNKMKDYSNWYMYNSHFVVSYNLLVILIESRKRLGLLLKFTPSFWLPASLYSASQKLKFVFMILQFKFFK